jgi:hypothetical protein
VVVVADLVARVRAEGVQETAAQVRAVGQSAQETARALEIMAQAAARANPSQGGAGQILEVFQKANVQPTAAALAQARAEMEKLAAAATQAVQPSQAVARAARDHVEAAASGARAAQNVAEGWKLSESSLVRFGAGLAGVGLGFSIVAGAARLIHDAVEGIVTRQLDWERSLVTLSGLYGEAGSRAAAFAQAQASLPNVLGSNQEFAQAGINASVLTQRYGVPQQTVDQLTTSGGRVAFALGLNDPAARQALQAQLLQAVTSGGQIPQLGIYTDPEAVARRLGTPGAQTLQAYTPQEILSARAAITSGSANAFAAQAEANQRGLLAATAATEKALERAQTSVTDVLENGLGGGLDQSPTADLAYQQAYGDEQLRQRRAALGLPEVAASALPGVAAVGGPVTAALQGNAEDSLRALTTAQIAYAQTLADSDKAQEQSRQALDALSHSADAAGARLLGFTGSLEDQRSIGHGDILAQAQGAVAARAIGPNPLIARTPAEMAVTARETAEQQAYQSYVADRARANERDSGSAIRQYLQGQVQFGPGADRPAAQRALDEIQRRYLANTVSGQAQQAGAFAQRAQAEAQSTLGEISVRQDERRLEVAERMAGYRHDALTLEGQLTPLILAQANLQDRIAVAARDNLQSRRALITAQQAALPSQFALSSMDYEQQRLELRAEVSRASVRRGDAPTEDIADLRAQYRNLELGRPELEVQHLDQSRAVDLVQQQREQEDLARQQRLTDLEQEGRSLQDQQIPLEQQLRATEAREQSVQRTLDLLALQDVAQQTAAGHAVNSAQLLAIQAGEADRAAQDMAAGLELGATRAERQAAALERSQTAMSSIFAMTTQQQDVDARIANGLGAGGLGPSAGQSPTPVFHINVSGGSVQQMKDQVHQEVENALNQFFAGSNTTGAPAGVGAAGAGR